MNGHLQACPPPEITLLVHQWLPPDALYAAVLAYSSKNGDFLRPSGVDICTILQQNAPIAV
jgi:hypothetical protein